MASQWNGALGANNLNDGRWLNLYNSSVFISDENQFYNKSKLVVGIEKMPYKKLIESEGIFTPTEGRSKILPNGDIFIEETDNGKIIIGNRNKKKISFAKRINSNYITHMELE